MQWLLKYDKPTCQGCHEKKFVEYDFNWKLIHRIPRIATFKTNVSIFQYKLLNNLVYFNKNLFHFGVISQSNCSFCRLYDETLEHPFYKCTKFMEPTLIISFRKSYITSFKFTECHFLLY